MKKLLERWLLIFKSSVSFTFRIAKYSPFYVRVHCLEGLTGKTERKDEFKLSPLRFPTSKHDEKFITKDDD